MFRDMSRTGPGTGFELRTGKWPRATSGGDGLRGGLARGRTVEPNWHAQESRESDRSVESYRLHTPSTLSKAPVRIKPQKSIHCKTLTSEKPYTPGSAC